MPDIMGKMDIAFPNLGIYLKNVPKDFEVFGFRIALYGVIIGTGVLLAILLITYLAGKTGQDPDIYWDISVYVIVFSIIGARAYYVFFAWDEYKNNLLSIFNIRNGGLAIYGGVIAGFLVLAVFVKVRKQSFRLMADTGVYGLILGQILGRWGNFTNREAFGQYSDGLFAMRLPIEMVRQNEITESISSHIVEGTNYIQVHPTFLYESMWNLGLLIIMLLYLKHKKFHGEIFLMYMGGYGIGRVWVESLRTDQLHIRGTSIPVSLLLGMLLFIGAIAADIAIRIYMRKKGGRLASDIRIDEANRLSLEKKKLAAETKNQ